MQTVLRKTATALIALAMALPVVNAAASEKAQAGGDYEFYKSPTCGCCGDWADHMTDHGFRATVNHPEDLNAIKLRHGIAPEYQSCHTAVFEGDYAFEGHVPARYVKRFLAEKPEGAVGLAVPGMPLGSPGMEVGDRFTPYQVLMIMEDGSHRVYADITAPDQQ